MRFLWAKDLITEEAHEGMLEVYGGKCIYQEQSWITGSRNSVEDELAPPTSRVKPVPVEVAAEAIIHCVETARADRRVSMDDVAGSVDHTHGAAYNIMHRRLKSHEVCTRWVPGHLSAKQKLNRMRLSMKHFIRYHMEGVGGGGRLRQTNCGGG